MGENENDNADLPFRGLWADLCVTDGGLWYEVIEIHQRTGSDCVSYHLVTSTNHREHSADDFAEHRLTGTIEEGTEPLRFATEEGCGFSFAKLNSSHENSSTRTLTFVDEEENCQNIYDKMKPNCEKCNSPMTFMHRDSLPRKEKSVACDVHEKYYRHRDGHHAKIAFDYESREDIHRVGSYYHCRGCRESVCGGCALIRKEAEFKRRNFGASMKMESLRVAEELEVSAQSNSNERPSKKRKLSEVAAHDIADGVDYKALYLAEAQKNTQLNAKYEFLTSKLIEAQSEAHSHRKQAKIAKGKLAFLMNGFQKVLSQESKSTSATPNAVSPAPSSSISMPRL